MIKRVLAFLILGLFISFKCFIWIPSYAMSGVPAIDALEYTILQTIGMTTQNGMEFDFTNSLADIIHDVQEGIFSIEYGVKEFLHRFANEVWNHKFYVEGDNIATTLNLLSIPNLTGFSSATISYINRIYQNKILDNDIDMTIPVSESDISFWNQYGLNVLNRMYENINAIPDDTIIVNPDPAYSTYINYINGDGFNQFYSYYSVGYLTRNNIVYPFIFDYNNTFSWFNSTVISNQSPGTSMSNPIFSGVCCTNYTADFYIYSVDDTYSYTVTLNLYDNFINTATTIPTYKNVGSSYNTNTASTGYTLRNTVSPYSTPRTISYSGSLEDCLKSIANFAHNVNIYVDGTPWSIVNQNIDNGITVSLPNAVIDNSTDDGKIVANPIYIPIDSSTGEPIESKYNLDKLYDYLATLIDGTNSDTTVGFDDLVDAGVIEDIDGNTLTDADISTKSISDVIAESVEGAATDSIVEEISGVIPGLPILPPLNSPQSGGDPLGGFRGMSVLARIVNVTNRSLPDDLIIMFYGIVATTIVLGLIKILHK